MLTTILYIILFWAVFFTITYSTHYLYIEKGFMPNPWTYLDYKPFNCHKCMTTWSLISAYIMMGMVFSNIVFTVFGVILSALYGYGLYYQEVERIVVEEDFQEPEQKPIGFTSMAEISPVETYEEYEDEYDTEIYAKKVGNKKKK